MDEGKAQGLSLLLMLMMLLLPLLLLLLPAMSEICDATEAGAVGGGFGLRGGVVSIQMFVVYLQRDCRES